MLIIVAGRTAPNRAVRFGAESGPLDGRGRSGILALAASLTRATGPVFAGPERSAVESAALLSDLVTPVPGFSSLDVGRWRGLAPEEIPPAELGSWFGDPASAPHGGESVTDFVARIRTVAALLDTALLGTIPRDTDLRDTALRDADLLATAPRDTALLVVAKPVAQALLCSGPHDFFAHQLRPASLHRPHPRGHGPTVMGAPALGG